MTYSFVKQEVGDGSQPLDSGAPQATKPLFTPPKADPPVQPGQEPQKWTLPESVAEFAEKQRQTLAEAAPGTLEHKARVVRYAVLEQFVWQMVDPWSSMCDYYFVGVYEGFALCLIDATPYKIPYEYDAESGDVTLGEVQEGAIEFGNMSEVYWELFPDDAFLEAPNDGVRALRHHAADGTIDVEALMVSICLESRYRDVSEHLLDHLNGSVITSEMKASAALVEESTGLMIESIEVDLGEASVDDSDPDLIRNVTLIRPGWSENNRYYGKKVLGKSASMWEGAKAHIDHSRDGSPYRSVMEMIGYHKDVHQARSGELKANFKMVGAEDRKEHVREWIKESQKEGKPFVGLSIVAMGKTELGEAEGRKGTIVVEITSAYSVDVVSEPAAGGGFEQLVAGMTEMNFEEWRKVVPDTHLATLKKSLISERQDAAIKERDATITTLTEEKVELEGQVNELTEANESLETTNKELELKVHGLELGVLVDSKLRESRLPSSVYEFVRPRLLETVAPEEMDTIIADEVAKAERLVADPRVTGVGPSDVAASVEAVAEGFSRSIFGFTGPMPRPGEGAEEYRARRLAEKSQE